MRILKETFIIKNLKKDLIILLIIILLPFVFFVFKLAPQTQIWSNNLFTVDFGDYYLDAKYFVWFISLKILTLSILSIWFLTCKHYWRYFLFIPISVEVFKLYALMKGLELDVSLTVKISNTLLISIPYLILLLLISKSIGYYKYTKQSSNAVNNEINNEILKVSKFDLKNYKSVKKELIVLLNNKNNMQKKEYLIKLIELRDRITV